MKERKKDGTWMRQEMPSEFWSKYLKGRDHLRYLGSDGGVIL
jgi:hypothetical protein